MQVTPAVAAEDQLNARVHQPHPDNETRPDQTSKASKSKDF